MSPLAAVGVSYQDAPLQLLELVAYRADEIELSLRSLASLEGLDGAAILSTCNRTEVYAEFSSQQDPRHLAAFLAADRGIPLSELRAVLSLRTGSNAVARHLFRVAAGLDSIALGEDEIQGQVRAAHALALETGACGAELDGLFRWAVRVGRRVRRETPLGLSRRSLARSALDLVTEADGLSDRTVLVVGAGKVASAIVARLREEGARLLVCSRTEDRARRLASAGDEVLPLAHLHPGLIAADLLVCCTAAPHLVVDASQLRAAMEHRGGRPLLVVDLSLPRNIDGAIRDIPGVGLIDLQDLGRACIQDAPLLVEAARRGEAIVEQETERFVHRQASRRVDALITALRGMTEELCRAELERSLRGRELVDRETALRALRGALNKLLHGPTMAAKEAAAVEDERRLSDLRRMFGLDGSNARVSIRQESPGRWETLGPRPSG